jgi:hypothetical protein
VGEDFLERESVLVQQRAVGTREAWQLQQRRVARGRFGQGIGIIDRQRAIAWIGKLLLGIRTVREDGRAAGMGKALVRWLLWIVDGFPYFLPLVGFIVALTSTGHRRVGDMAAKTFVVRKAAMGSPIIVPGLTAPPVMEPAVAGAWGASAPPVGTPPGQPAVDRPQWDEARGTYIQWDPVEQSWMQWDEGQHTWLRIPGQ